ncbi:hypothetical protein LV79_003179 [Actinokineospora globicatena]|nr:hypothetical protein [Actinokineospora globicatena]GLW79392.1 hypothetical protein Aglo01_38740 [Actinokineospora globicatena]GLW86198.1 hypothetical protein Aglo02_38370 [Actinokineospora globicatena]
MMISRYHKLGARLVKRLAQLDDTTFDNNQDVQDRAGPGGASKDDLDNQRCRAQPLGELTDHRFGRSCDTVPQRA